MIISGPNHSLEKNNGCFYLVSLLIWKNDVK